MDTNTGLIDDQFELEALTDKAVKKAYETQAWPYQFKLRSQELKLVFDFLDIGRRKKMLEIGCGNAFGSALFSSKVDKIIATDLADYNLTTSTIGLNYADKLIHALDIGNISLFACSAEELPFADETFDLIFSAYVLEHVGNKEKVINEMRRVLKKGGIIITIVPNFMERLYAPFHFYPYLFKRAIAYFSKFLGIRSAGSNSTVVASKEAKKLNLPIPVSQRIKKFLKDYPNFPFCEPHGNYKCWREEFLSYLPRRWKNLFEYNGLKVLKLYSTMFIPHNFLTLFSEKVAYFVYSKSIFLTKKIGKNPIIKYLGYSLCLVAQK